MIRPMGLTVAIPARYITAATPDTMRSEVRDLAEQMIPRLRTYVGGATPRGPMSTKLDGPHNDTLQGNIYALTIAAPFDVNDLPVDCDAYLAFHGHAGRDEMAEFNPLAEG